MALSLKWLGPEMRLDFVGLQEAQRADQLVALLVARTSDRLPGLAGLFLAGLLSAAMGWVPHTAPTFSTTHVTHGTKH